MYVSQGNFPLFLCSSFRHALLALLFGFDLHAEFSIEITDSFPTKKVKRGPYKTQYQLQPMGIIISLCFTVRSKSIHLSKYSDLLLKINKNLYVKQDWDNLGQKKNFKSGAKLFTSKYQKLASKCFSRLYYTSLKLKRLPICKPLIL